MEANQLLDNNMVKYENQNQFMTAIQNMKYISNPLAELANSPSAIVYYGSPCCSLKCACNCLCKFNCDCGDNYIYSTLIPTNGEQRYLFKNLARLDCKICSSDKKTRFSFCKSFNLTSFEQFSLNDLAETSEMVKENNCIICGCCSYFLDVFTRPNNQLAGIIQYRGIANDCCKCKCDCCWFCKKCNCFCKKCNCQCDLCHDYYYVCDILSNARQLVYTIYLRRCCLSCCPTDCFDHLSFVIRSGDVNVGSIELKRNCCNCCGLMGNYCTYNINFPADAPPELKLTIINAVISMDIFVV